MTKWDFWKGLTKDKIEWNETDPEFVSSYSPFLMNQILSNINLYLKHTSILNCIDIPKETHYRYLFNILPKTYQPVSEIKIKKHNNEDEKYVAKYFEFGTKDTKDAMKLLTEQDIKNIKKKYGKLK
jgi:hypothetical protein